MFALQKMEKKNYLSVISLITLFLIIVSSGQNVFWVAQFVLDLFQVLEVGTLSDTHVQFVVDAFILVIHVTLDSVTIKDTFLFSFFCRAKWQQDCDISACGSSFTFTLMCFNYFCSTTKNKQKMRKKNDNYQTFLTQKLNIHVYPTCCLKPKRNFEVKLLE